MAFFSKLGYLPILAALVAIILASTFVTRLFSGPTAQLSAKAVTRPTSSIFARSEYVTSNDVLQEVTDASDRRS